MFLSGEQIYQNFQQAQGGAQLGQAAALLAELSKGYDAQADEIKKLVGATETAWKGGASGAAQRGVGPLAVEHAMAAPNLNTAQDLVSRQVGSFDSAKNTVKPVPPAPEKVDPVAAFLAPGPFMTYRQQLGEHNAAAQHNVDVMRSYEGASIYNMDLPSSYGTLTADQSEIKVAGPSAHPGGGGGDGPGAGVPMGPGPSGGGGQVGPSGGGGSVPGGPGVGSGPPAGSGSTNPAPPQSGTTPGGFLPPTTKPGGPRGQGTGFEPGGGPGSGVPATDSGPGFLGVPGPPAGGGARLDGRGPFGSGGPGGAGSGAGGPGSGGRSTVGPLGGVEAAGRGVRGSGGPAARGGPGGQPMGAGVGGRGAGGEDEEHETASYLQNPDPEATFGTDEKTSPPVIGG